MNELKESIIHINNAKSTLVWVSYIDDLFEDRLVLSCYHTTCTRIVMNYIIRNTDNKYRVTCEKYLHGKLLCVVDSIVEDEQSVLMVVMTFLKMGFGGIA